MKIVQRLNELDRRVVRVRYVPKPEAERLNYLQDVAQVRNQYSYGYAEAARQAITELAAEVVLLRQQVDQLLAERHA